MPNLHLKIVGWFAEEHAGGEGVICSARDDDGRSRRVKRRYTVLIERGPTSFGATVPDLPGCVAVAKSRRAVLMLIAEAITAHVASMEADGEVVPEPAHEAVVIEVGEKQREHRLPRSSAHR